MGPDDESTLFQQVSLPSSAMLADSSTHARTFTHSQTVVHSLCNMYTIAKNTCLHSLSYAVYVKCKGKGPAVEPGWMLDSRASLHFTPERNDFMMYQEVDTKMNVQTVNRVTKIVGTGSVMIHFVDLTGQQSTIHLCPVDHIPGINAQLLSMGELLDSKGSTIGPACPLCMQLITNQE